MAEPVLVVGSIAIDHVKTPFEEHTNLLGGSASYAAVAASFYAPVRLVGVVGTDFPIEHRNLLERRRVDLAGLEVAEGKTFRWAGEYEQNMNNRRTLSVELNVFEHFKPKLPPSWRETGYVLLGNIAPALQLEVLRQMQKPRFVVADTMDLWINLARTDLLELLKQVDMLILNDSEAYLLAEKDNLVKAGRAIREMGPRYVVIKKGEHGAVLFGPGGGEALFASPAYPLEGVLDPTGAGDSFVGALAGSLAREGQADWASLKRAIVEGTLVASFTCEAFSLRKLEALGESELSGRRTEFRDYTLVG